ncbi:VOC family protein [Salinifilum ghardaiensis]
MARPVGAPGWVELPTQEAAATRDFYTGLFGWSWLERPAYNIAFQHRAPVAGVRVPAPSDPPVPAHWTLFVECGDTARTADRVQELGGRVVIGPTGTPGDEVFAVARDPAGAVLGLWQAPPDGDLGHDNDGMLSWAELHTWDSSRVDSFYTALFGYRQEPIGDMNSDIDYAVWYLDDLPTLGRFVTTAAVPEFNPGQWHLYFQVNPAQDADAAVARVRELGGAELRPPSDSPYGRIALVRDVVGAPFFLIDTATRTGE